MVQGVILQLAPILLRKARCALQLYVILQVVEIAAASAVSMDAQPQPHPVIVLICTAHLQAKVVSD